MGNRRDSGWAVLLAGALLALSAPSTAGAATVVNGNFESGTLAGWSVNQATQAGNWFAYQGTDAPIGHHRTNSAPVQPPPQGAYAGTTDEANPDTLILYQDVALEPGLTHLLSLLVYYNSHKPIAVPAPDTLSVDEEALGGQGNQQYRIDVMKPDAPIESVDPADILRTVFETKPGDPKAMAPTKLTVDLTPFAGQTVRLRIANAAHEEVFNAGVDAVSISSTPPGGGKGTKGTKGSKGSPGGGGSKPGPTLFSFDEISPNPKNGTVALRVRVPGSGLLRAKGEGAPSATARPSEAGGLRRPIEPVTIPTESPKTVTIHLRPTSSARAVLRHKHRLRVEVAVTYMPTGDSAETASLPVVFRLADRPRPRRH